MESRAEGKELQHCWCCGSRDSGYKERPNTWEHVEVQQTQQQDKEEVGQAAPSPAAGSGEDDDESSSSDSDGGSGTQPVWQRWCKRCGTQKNAGKFDAWLADPSQRPAATQGVWTVEGCTGCLRDTPPQTTIRKDGKPRRKRKRKRKGVLSRQKKTKKA